MEALGPYQLVMKLATGGMATAFLARHTGALGFQRPVVIKRVHPHLVSLEGTRMLRDEAMITTLIRHPNVVAITDVVETGAELLLVLDYVESLSLFELTRALRGAGEQIPPALASRIVIDVLSGLHAAHEAVDLHGEPLDLIHRDVSPHNILVGADGSSRLIDFGIAKARGRITETTSGVLKGKLPYMSPEQIKQRPLDRRSDVFSAGIILFELLTGRRLFLGADESELGLGVLIADIPSVSSVAPGLSNAVDDLVGGALEREVDRRPPTAKALLEALEATIPPAPPRAVAELVGRIGAEEFDKRRASLRAASPPSREVTGPTRPMDDPTIVMDVAPSRTSRSVVVLGGAAIVLAGAVGILLMTRRSPPQPEAPSPPVTVAPVASAPTPSVSASSPPAPPSAEPAPTARAPATARPNAPVVRPPTPSRGDERGGKHKNDGLHESPYRSH